MPWDRNTVATAVATILACRALSAAAQLGRITKQHLRQSVARAGNAFSVCVRIWAALAGSLVHFAFFLSLVFGIVAYARRFNFPRAGVFAALPIYASPVFGFDGTRAYNDVAATCVVFFVFYVLRIWRRRGRIASLS